MKNEPPYNPLDKKNLGTSVADALLVQSPSTLPPGESFEGAGVYAIYYVGDFAPYRSLKDKNLKDDYSAPIYVGKAIPPGARKGGVGLGEAPGPALYDRLKEHADSIKKAKDLKLEHFRCRYLVVDDIWIPLGESLLIKMFSPLWNLVIDGFGNHDPGKGRYEQMRSAWDILHPGRVWAERCQPNPKTQADLLSEIKIFLSKPSPPEATIKKPQGE